MRVAPWSRLGATKVDDGRNLVEEEDKRQNKDLALGRADLQPRVHVTAEASAWDGEWMQPWRRRVRVKVGDWDGFGWVGMVSWIIEM
jgi:hypothetical protein